MRRLVSAMILGLVAASPSHASGTLDGRWLTQDTRAIVEVGPCGPAECGKIVWVKDPISPETGKPRRDKNNPDESLQHRPIIGLPTLFNIVPNVEGDWNAVSYDPRSGEEHEITIKLAASATKIVLRGCGLGGLICRSEVWTKAPDAAPTMNPASQTNN
jgi:uncharacterized protein (DUF2147 family)